MRNIRQNLFFAYNTLGIPIAAARGQTLAQMSLAWLLRDRRVTSVLIGASSVEQIQGNLAAAGNIAFTADELAKIDVACLGA